jgi:hypothetical protein
VPRITRKLSPPLQSNYQAYKHYLRQDFGYRCAYCSIHEYTWGSHRNFDIDHFRPQSIFRELELAYSNLYWTCNRCNRLKRNIWPSKDLLSAGIRFIDPCDESPTRHYYDDGQGSLVATTAPGSYTIRQIRLNRPGLVWLREKRRAKLREIAGHMRTLRRLRNDLDRDPLDDIARATIPYLERLITILVTEHFRPPIPIE